MSVADPDLASLTGFALAAGDLLVEADGFAIILSAVGEAHLLHHPTCDRLIGKNIVELISEAERGRLREDLWSLAPGRRLCWEDQGGLEGGRRILVQRNPSDPDRFRVILSRTPPLIPVNGDRIEDILAERFRDAVTGGELSIARQPVVDTRTGAISHFEILARFEAERSPADLIAAAERSGQICQLDYIMVRAAADRLATVGDPAFRLAVNISGDSIQRPDVTDELCALVRGYRIDPGRLIVEITESSRIADIDAAARGVRRLRQVGLSVSLDDFGSGAASFGYLRALDVDSLKFDGSFLEDSGSSVRGLALIRHLARMCEELGVASVGERVETEADRALLMEAGVRYAQGYLFGRPVIDRSFRVGGRSSLSAVA